MESKLFRAVVEHIADPIWLLAESGNIRYASPASAHVLGYSPEELTGVNAFDFFLPSDRAKPRAKLYGGGIDAAVFRLRRKDGAVIWAEVAGVNRLADAGIEAVIVTLHDVTQSRRAERLLRD